MSNKQTHIDKYQSCHLLFSGISKSKKISFKSSVISGSGEAQTNTARAEYVQFTNIKNKLHSRNSPLKIQILHQIDTTTTHPKTIDAMKFPIYKRFYSNRRGIARIILNL